MKITPQDIIDKEFRVKFRGFDMAEVDAFLEEVAENFFRLAEENTLLHEKVLALQKELEGGYRMTPQQVQLEIPAELGNALEELKQDTMAIGAELVALKQDRQVFDSLEKSTRQGFAALQEALDKKKSQGQIEFPGDLDKALHDFTLANETIRAELAALKEERQGFDSLRKNLEEVFTTAQEAAAAVVSQGERGLSAGSDNMLQEFRLANETISAELIALKQDVGSLLRFREEIKGEIQGLFKTHLQELDARVSGLGVAVPPPLPTKAVATPPQHAAATARIGDEDEEIEEDTRLPDYEEPGEAPEDNDLEFLTEDDLLDVDKLRGIFQSVLDDSLSDAHDSREEGADSNADLLFLDDALIADEHEPEVTFSLEEKKAEKKTKSKRA